MKIKIKWDADDTPKELNGFVATVVRETTELGNKVLIVTIDAFSGKTPEQIVEKFPQFADYDLEQKEYFVFEGEYEVIE